MSLVNSPLIKYISLVALITTLHATDNPDRIEQNQIGHGRQQELQNASERRIQTIKNYAKETGMQHLPLMFASKDEILQYYAEDIALAKKLDEQSDNIPETQPIPGRKRLRKIVIKDVAPSETRKRTRDEAFNEVSDDLDDILLDSDVESISSEAPPRKLFKPLSGTPSLPKFKPSQSVHKNPGINPDLQGTVIVYDSETTNLSPKCGGRLVELAAIKVIDGIPRETLHILLNPDMKSWAGAFKAHGLHESFLRSQAHFYTVAKYIEDFFGQDIRVAHNGFKFDDPYLNFEIRRAQVFWQFRSMLSPEQDFSEQAPKSFKLSPEARQKGYDLLKERGIISNSDIQENLQEKANLLSAAAMLYFFKGHMNQLTTGYNNDKKPGPMMFNDDRILPDSEKYPKNHEAAVARLAWFRLIRQDTDTIEQRAQLKQPYVKYIRDAIQSAEVYLDAVVKIFNQNILDEVAFREDPLDPSKMFDTLVHVRSHPEQFTRAVTVDNLKLDSLIDYYHLNRHARETGTHGAAIDTSLLYQVLRKLVGAKDDSNPALQRLLSKPQTEIEEFLFAKNSIRYLDDQGQVTNTVQLFDDQIPGTTRDRNGRRPEKAQEAPSSSNTQSGISLIPHPQQPVPNNTAPTFPSMMGMPYPMPLPYFPQSMLPGFNGVPAYYIPNYMPMPGMFPQMPYGVPFTGPQMQQPFPWNHPQ